MWNFILLLTEDDSTLKAAWQITFRWLVAYKPVAHIKKCSQEMDYWDYWNKKLALIFISKGNSMTVINKAQLSLSMKMLASLD